MNRKSLHNFTIKQLRFFVALSEELHFGKAAQRLNITQSPLSQAIKSLEGDIGFQLFRRTKRSVELTPCGDKWLKDVRSALASLDQLSESAEQTKSGKLGSICLLSDPVSICNPTCKIVSKYLCDFPDVHLSIRQLPHTSLLKSASQREFDLGITADQSLINKQSFEGFCLNRQKLIIAVPSSWINSSSPLYEAHKLKVHELIDSQQVALSRIASFTFSDKVSGLFNSVNSGRKIAQTTDCLLTLLNLVGEGVGFAVVPEVARTLHPSGVEFFSMDTQQSDLETFLFWDPNNLSPSARQFLELASDLAISGNETLP